MGTCTFLTSDSKREWLDLGKLFLSEGFLIRLQKKTRGAMFGSIREDLVEYMAEDPDDINGKIVQPEAARAADLFVEWIRTRSDWVFRTEYDDEMDEIYCAENAEDAAEWAAECAEEGYDLSRKIYMKTGTIWPEGEPDKDDIYSDMTDADEEDEDEDDLDDEEDHDDE